MAALAFGGAARAQTPANPALPDIPPLPGSPAIPGRPRVGTLGAAHRQPILPQVRQNDTETRRIQSETDDLYQEIMRRSAPPGSR